MAEDIDELLRPAFDALKHQAQSAIDATTKRMENVLRVRYGSADKNSLHADLPTPRLQFRWEDKRHPCGSGQYTCWYEMVFALSEHDIRNDDKQGVCVVELGSTSVGGGKLPWDGDLCKATPFRDGAHAEWDSERLGGFPVFVIAPDGRRAKVNRSEKE